jgi:two-component system, chemotaxis family, CheB/CheR fusion protein
MKNILIVGASAGGLKAIENFIKKLPEEIDSAVVIIQHLSPDFKSMMSELLAMHTKIPISEVKPDMIIEANHIYLIPAGYSMTINERAFVLKKRGPEALPINAFMNSAAQIFKEKCIAVILSGSGFDGTIGCKTIRDHGGLILAQNPASAEFDSMPNSIVTHKLEHLVVEAEDIWASIKDYHGNASEYAEQQAHVSQEMKEIVEGLNIEYHELFSFLKRIYQLDFSQYKINSVSRRIHRRMRIHGIEDIQLYLQLLKDNSEETNDLYQDLLIGVTSFFRDSEIYDDLARLVIEPFFTQTEIPDQLRIWVAGCASGQEAYSYAILTDEWARRVEYTGRISIFATDVHKDSIQKSSLGIYGKHELEKMSAERLQKYFKLIEGGAYKIRPDIRQRVIFAQHNLLEDPPFTHMDIVSCRNMLIYFKGDAQETALQSLTYALKLNAHLILGSSEALGKFEKAYQTLSSRSKIYRKITGTRLMDTSPLFAKVLQRSSSLPLSLKQQKSLVSIESELLQAYDHLLKKKYFCGSIDQ